jgi:hypothetical protein
LTEISAFSFLKFFKQDFFGLVTAFLVAVISVGRFQTSQAAFCAKIGIRAAIGQQYFQTKLAGKNFF